MLRTDGVKHALEERFDSDSLLRLNGIRGDAALVPLRTSLKLPIYGGMVQTFDLTAPYRDRDVLIEQYWNFHPRYAFFKSIAPSGRLADFGAGSGNLIQWRSWGEPARQDIFMYAIDRVRGEHFDKFIDCDIVDIESEETKYPDHTFDAILCSHVIEFVENVDGLALETSRICRPGGRIYVEWPNADSANILSKDALAPLGIQCETLSIEDDPSQHASPAPQDVRAIFEAVGLRTVADGEIANDFLAPELVRCGVALNDREVTTYGLNLALRLARFLIFEKK